MGCHDLRGAGNDLLRQCATPLAPDQAYCVHCGARRGPLPARIAVALADIGDHGRPTAPDDPLLDVPHPEVEPESIVSAARTGIIAVLVMLAFGVVIGGAFSPGGLSALANTIVVAVRPSVQQAAQVVTTVAGESGGGGQSHHGGFRRRRRRWWRWRWRPGAPKRSHRPRPGAGDASLSARPVRRPRVPTTPQATLPSIDHVWLIVLGQQGYQQAWATSAGHPYLGTLRKPGELVPNYDAVASSPLANEVALLSGQGPTPQTRRQLPDLHLHRSRHDRQAAAGARRRLHLPADDRVAAAAVRRRRLELEGLHPGDRLGVRHVQSSTTTSSTTLDHPSPPRRVPRPRPPAPPRHPSAPFHVDQHHDHQHRRHAHQHPPTGTTPASPAATPDSPDASRSPSRPPHLPRRRRRPDHQLDDDHRLDRPDRHDRRRHLPAPGARTVQASTRALRLTARTSTGRTR